MKLTAAVRYLPAPRCAFGLAVTPRPWHAAVGAVAGAAGTVGAHGATAAHRTITLVPI